MEQLLSRALLSSTITGSNSRSNCCLSQWGGAAFVLPFSPHQLEYRSAGTEETQRPRSRRADKRTRAVCPLVIRTYPLWILQRRHCSKGASTASSLCVRRRILQTWPYKAALVCSTASMFLKKKKLSTQNLFWENLFFFFFHFHFSSLSRKKPQPEWHDIVTERRNGAVKPLKTQLNAAAVIEKVKVGSDHYKQNGTGVNLSK